MITKEELDIALYNKYIRPTERAATGKAGIEFELPIVNIDGNAANFNVIHKAAEAFVRHFNFTNEKRDDDGELYNAEDCSGTGDNLSFDCSYNTLEFSFGTDDNIKDTYSRFIKYYSFFQDKLLEGGHSLTGMGINPRYDKNHIVPIKNGRYRMLLHHLESYKKYSGELSFHDYPYFGLFSCASQVQLDAEKEDLPLLINTFNRLEPLKAVLFANSPFYIDDQHDFIASRDFFWKHSLHGLNPHNVDGYDFELTSVDSLVAYYRSMSLYCLDRDGKYINFRPTPLLKYFNSEYIEGEFWNGNAYEQIRFTPDIRDLEYLRSFKFNDVTFRGTIEFRSVCEQPVYEIMAPSAFHIGLVQKASELSHILQKDASFIYEQGYSIDELREIFTKKPDKTLFYNEDALYDLLYNITELSREGLLQRGFGEEEFLKPLYRRIDERTNPASEYLSGLANGRDIDYYIMKYSSIKETD